MKYFFDLDGTITVRGGLGASEIKIPWFLLWIIFVLYKPKTNSRILQIIEKIKSQGDEIIIITSRPERLRKITLKYLEEKGVYFDKIFFVNTGPNSFLRKIEKIEELGVCTTIFDNSKKVIDEARRRGIKGILI